MDKITFNEAMRLRKFILYLWRLKSLTWEDAWKELYNIGFRGQLLNGGFLPK